MIGAMIALCAGILSVKITIGTISVAIEIAV